MIKWFIKFCGNFASFIGRFDKYTEEHHKFLQSGYKCPHCNEYLMKPYGVADVNCYDDNDRKVSLAFARIKGKYFECPKCKYRWKLRNK